MYFDVYYLILVVPALIFAMFAQSQVSRTFSKYSTMRTYSGMTGYEAARRILDANGLRHVGIERVSGHLTDHYDPRTNVIRLSDEVYNTNSVSAVGVAAHEAGHAVQYAKNYVPVKIRSAIIPVTQLGSTLSMPLVLIGFFMGAQPLVNFGLLLFATVTAFQLVTLPVEFNASNRAVYALETSGTIVDEELSGVKKVLGAAAMTYVAALAVSLANLLRLVMIFGRRDD